MRKITLSFSIIICLLATQQITAQNIWNGSSFKLTADTAPLESMAGATPVTILNISPYATDTIYFPGNFSMQFGLTKYRQFSVSAYGAVKLGTKITQAALNLETDIIVPLSDNVNKLTCSYRMSGTAPFRKMIFEWNGTYPLSSQTVRMQLWLYENGGKIAFVYQNLNNIGMSSYYSFCKTSIAGYSARAYIDVQTPPAAPLVNYTLSSLSNNEAIPPNTRYLFEPDTNKPAAPLVEFSNIMPGCLTASVRDGSDNESFFSLEKKLTGNNYELTNRHLSTAMVGTGILYNNNLTVLKPDSLYGFRAFASNGFRNSDTVYQGVHTPAAMITGVKNIPGDYVSINALLADAACKHMGPDLLIELQPDYSYAAEGGIINFTPALGHRHINNITIRPAAGVTSLTLVNASGGYPMFLIDSVKNVHLDGRPGGLGNTGVLTITQGNVNYPTLAFIGKSDGAGLHYINFNGRSTRPDWGVVYIGYQNPAVIWSQSQGPINDALISNCKFGAASGLNLGTLVMHKGSNNTVRDNEFFNYSYVALDYAEPDDNNKIISNRFYQPAPVTSFGGDADRAVMSFLSVRKKLLIDSNSIGGSAAQWGIGSYNKKLSRNFYAFIKTFTSPGAELQDAPVVSNNRFGNINLTGFFSASLIDCQGNSYINNNTFGTTDSVKSISAEYINKGIYANRGTKTTIRNNFFSGMHSTGSLTSIYSSTIDSAFISNNNVGGSDNYHANQAQANGAIDLSATLWYEVTHNEIHGQSSYTYGNTSGISQETTSYTNTIKHGRVDSNRIHHLEGSASVAGISMLLNSIKATSISGNEIYALRGVGSASNSGARGIVASAGELTANVPSKDTGYLSISHNRIYAIDHIPAATTYTNGFSVLAIGGSGLDVRVNNNMISLGKNIDGQNVDSLETGFKAISLSSTRGYIEHNSIYIGGRGISPAGIIYPIRSNTTGLKEHFISNNIIQLDRIGAGGEFDNKTYLLPVSGQNHNIVSNKNIWYSASDLTIAAKLQAQRAAGLDSLTIIANPAFVNPANLIIPDLHLGANSPADSAGTPSVKPVWTDFDGQSRMQLSAADIGADAATPCALPANTGVSISPGQAYIEICPGSILQLSATISGSFISLQWQKNLNDIPGATGTTLEVTTSGNYRLVGKTACGLMGSNSVLIHTRITQPFIKLESLQTGYICSGTPIEFKVNHNHHTLTTLEYKWYRNNVLIPGKTTDHEWIELNANGDIINVTITNATPCSTYNVSSQLFFSSVYSSTRPQITLKPYVDTLYSTMNSDTVRFSVTDRGYGWPQVLYSMPVAAAFHRILNDSTVVFTDIPYSFKFKVLVDANNTCYYADTTAEQTIYVTESSIPLTYTFNGNGNFNSPANWLNQQMPPSPLPFNATVIINPSGTCILNIPFVVGYGGQFIVMQGAQVVIQGNLQIE